MLAHSLLIRGFVICILTVYPQLDNKIVFCTDNSYIGAIFVTLLIIRMGLYVKKGQ